ncbi:hypothetical protein BDV95DRAFT_599403 [Massariosphaeria phaeospora]|uniref:Mid2 domain-containing protein n=1 Tax=Massariosphaeria phaeospora TaxID=100035 RepID=A0A7C8M160_9PLEO|nr:hypothetical protein BDV95DRAFT_599403 [Massariosphaeria phaeospora]
MKPILSIAFGLSLLTPIIDAACYFPDGQTIHDTPCNPGATHSTCCGPGYACLSNNVCALTEHVTPGERKFSSYYVRASCTDRNWAAKECPSFCKNAANGDNVGIGGMGVAKCDGDGSVDRYYCRNSQTAELSENAICTNLSYYFEFPGFPSTVTIIGVQSTSAPSPDSSVANGSTSPTPSSTPASTPTPTPTPTSKKDSVALGAGLGVGLGIPLIMTVVVIAVLLRRRWGSNSNVSELNALDSPTLKEIGTNETPCTPTDKWSPQHSVHEVTSDYAIHEVHSTEAEAHELSVKRESQGI